MWAAAVSVCIWHVPVSCGHLYPDQVPAWLCLDLDSFMHLVEWPTPIWIAGILLLFIFTTPVYFCFNIASVDQFKKCTLPLYRPVVVIGGSSDRNQETAGAFQEFPQVLYHMSLCFLVCWCFIQATLFSFGDRWKHVACTASFLPDPAVWKPSLQW